jgi:hypothetical protein
VSYTTLVNKNKYIYYYWGSHSSMSFPSQLSMTSYRVLLGTTRLKASSLVQQEVFPCCSFLEAARMVSCCWMKPGLEQESFSIPYHLEIQNPSTSKLTSPSSAAWS